MLIALGLLAATPRTDSFAQEKRSLALFGRPSEARQTKSSTTAKDADVAKPDAQDSAKATHSRGVEDVMKLADAKVSKEVMLSFVETSSVAYQPSAGEVIAMKSRGVPDEVITAMLKQGAKVKAQVAQARREVAGPAIVRDLSTRGNLDPENYDFFFYHYLYPRALSYSYKTLAPYSPAYSPRNPFRHSNESRRGNSWSR